MERDDHEERDHWKNKKNRMTCRKNRDSKGTRRTSNSKKSMLHKENKRDKRKTRGKTAALETQDTHEARETDSRHVNDHDQKPQTEPTRNRHQGTRKFEADQEQERRNMKKRNSREHADDKQDNIQGQSNPYELGRAMLFPFNFCEQSARQSLVRSSVSTWPQHSSATHVPRTDLPLSGSSPTFPWNVNLHAKTVPEPSPSHCAEHRTSQPRSCKHIRGTICMRNRLNIVAHIKWVDTSRKVGQIKFKTWLFKYLSPSFRVQVNFCIFEVSRLCHINKLVHQNASSSMKWPLIFWK